MWIVERNDISEEGGSREDEEEVEGRRGKLTKNAITNEKNLYSNMKYQHQLVYCSL